MTSVSFSPACQQPPPDLPSAIHLTQCLFSMGINTELFPSCGCELGSFRTAFHR